MLAGAPCASQLTHLEFKESNLCPKTVPIVSNIFVRDYFPALERLTLFESVKLCDDGVAALANGLSAACDTRLKSLDLQDVGMGDKGMFALAGLVHRGRFERLELLSISDNEEVSDQGVIALARAIEEAGKCGLPMLRKLWATGLHFTGAGMGVLASALIHKCPCLTLASLHESEGSDDDTDEVGTRECVEGMVRAADCKYRLRFNV